MSRPVRFRRAGTGDRVARALLGLALLSLTAWGPRTAWGFLGLIPLAAGLIGNCPTRFAPPGRRSGAADQPAEPRETAEREP